MKTNNKLSAYILRGSTAALLFLSVIVALCSAINLPEQSRKALPAQDNAAFEANAHQNGNLSFAERVAYQRAIEEVHWRHRIWPKERPNPKPLLAVVMSQATIEKKVQDYLRKSELLEREWEKPIRPEQLQAEMDRMVTPSSPRCCASSLQRSATIPLSSRSVWPGRSSRNALPTAIL